MSKFWVKKITFKQKLHNIWVDIKNIRKVRVIGFRLEYLVEELDISEEEFYDFVKKTVKEMRGHITKPKYYRRELEEEE